MALQFTNSSSQYLSSGPEFDLGTSWGFSATVTVDSDITMIIAGARGSTTNQGWQIFRAATTETLNVTYFGTALYTSNSNVLPSGGEYRVGIRVLSGTLYFYVDGVSAGTASVGTYNALSAGYGLFIGQRNNLGSPVAGFSWDGKISEVALWSSDPGEAMLVAIGKGASPQIQPNGLAHYWKITGRNSPEPDYIGDSTVTLVNTPTYADHPRTFYQTKSTFVPYTVSAGGFFVRRYYDQFLGAR